MGGGTPWRQSSRIGRVLEVLVVFLRLGLTSFGGPIAHIGYFRREFVERRRWMSEAGFTDLVALCQFLPGPASSQTGFCIGLHRAGWAGGLAAWCGFTLPSMLFMIACAIAAPKVTGPMGVEFVHGLKLVAVAVVAQAVWDMGRRLCPDRRRTAIALASLALLSVLATVYAQLIVIAGGALLGLALCRSLRPDAVRASHDDIGAFAVSRNVAVVALTLFVALLLGLPLLRGSMAGQCVRTFEAFYRSGALVFGGGHVVLPLLQQQTVATGWISPGDFLAGYGAAQAVPGPLFTFAAFLGWMMPAPPNHWSGALLATAAIFLPGLLLVVAALPCWQLLRARPAATAAFAGVNAAVVGLLAFALYSPVWVGAVRSPVDFVVAVTAFFLLVRWRMPPLVVVAICIVASAGTGLVLGVGIR